jgi:hypothetical protein
VRALTALAAGVLAAGCGRGVAAPPPVVLAGADTLVSQQAGDIGMAVDLAVDERGDAYVLDYMLHQVLVVPADGGRARVIGQRGGGPGELAGPVAVSAAGDSVRVADRGNARVQVFTRDGVVARSVPVAERFMGMGSAFSATGRLAFATFGVQDDALARLVEPDGRSGPGLGRAAVRPSAVMDFAAIKRQIARGRIPPELRNHARAVPSGDGGVWLVLLSEPAVVRYGADLRERWRLALDAPEIEAIRARFFRTNRALRSPAAFFPLSYVADAVEGGGRLWLLVDTGEDGPAMLLVVDAAGSPPVRVEVPDVIGARQIAVDARHRRLYLALASAELVFVPLPADLAP